jgi:hypothetical protein
MKFADLPINLPDSLQVVGGSVVCLIVGGVVVSVVWCGVNFLFTIVNKLLTCLSVSSRRSRG